MLCDPLSNFVSSPVLAGSVESQLLLLYVVEKDIHIIVGFYKAEIPPDRDDRAMELGFTQMFLSFAQSSRSQAFMVWLGDKPLFVVEIHNAKMHFPYERNYQPTNNDYYMVVKAGAFNQAGFSLYVHGLQLALDYFWNFSELQTIIALVQANPWQDQQARLFLQAGMTRTLEITGPEPADLYRIDRPL